jgi:hypothetical protein
MRARILSFTRKLPEISACHVELKNGQNEEPFSSRWASQHGRSPEPRPAP